MNISEFRVCIVRLRRPLHPGMTVLNGERSALAFAQLNTINAPLTPS
jgi:hypothetical protein